jgi:hypothetical protein
VAIVQYPWEFEMSRTKVGKTESYVAVDESGSTYDIDIWTTFTEYKPVNGSAQWVPGAKAHKLQNGNHVNVNNDCTLVDVLTGLVMRRVST